jgi:hypothetical protein
MKYKQLLLLFYEITDWLKIKKIKNKHRISLQLTVEDVGETGSLFGWREKIRQMYKILTKSTG